MKSHFDHLVFATAAAAVGVVVGMAWRALVDRAIGGRR